MTFFPSGVLFFNAGSPESVFVDWSSSKYFGFGFANLLAGSGALKSDSSIALISKARASSMLPKWTERITSDFFYFYSTQLHQVNYMSVK